MSIADNLLRALARKGWSMADLARALGVNRSVVHGWKTGRIPRSAQLADIADHLGVTVADLFAVPTRKRRRAS